MRTEAFLLNQHVPSGYSTEHARGWFWRAYRGKAINSGDMDAEQELREYQREYLDFLDDGVSAYFSPLLNQMSSGC